MNHDSTKCSRKAWLENAACVVTEWEQFKAFSPDDSIARVAQPVVVDARRIFDPQQFRQGWSSARLAWATVIPLTGSNATRYI